MRPLTSGLSITPRRERKLPTACVSSVSFVISTIAASTDGGLPAVTLLLLETPRGNPAATVREADDTAAVSCGFWSHQAAPEAATIPAAITM